jgi:hydroxymethylbilane synthase
MKNKFIVGTRTSKLALFQTNKVILELKKNFKNFHFEIKEIKTKGDVLLNQTW